MGLKPYVVDRVTNEQLVFQTNPCGVEAISTPCTSVPGTGFRRTLVGLKLLAAAVEAGLDGFRRTLVGLKQHESEHDGYHDDLFQTNPCGVEAIGVSTNAPR